jgi:hypothetical protein
LRAHGAVHDRKVFLPNFYLPAADKIKSRRMGPEKRVARSEDIRNAYKILVGNLKGKKLLRDLNIHGTTLKGC